MIQTLTPITAPLIIRTAAALIGEHGWGSMAGSHVTPEPGVRGLSLTTAVLWAIKGSGASARDLSPLQATHLAETVDTLEVGLDMSVIAFERRYAHASPRQVATILREIAWAVEGELEPGDAERFDW
jgi:hypothetical protein